MGTDAMGDDGLDFGVNAMIRDEPGNRVRFRVEQADDPGMLELRLEMADYMTWWKSLSYFMRVGGSNIERYRIQTQNEDKSAGQFINSPELIQFGRLELWKAGVLNFGAYVASLDFNSWANRGRRFVFTWEQD
jgi:hypothetical protein